MIRVSDPAPVIPAEKWGVVSALSIKRRFTEILRMTCIGRFQSSPSIAKISEIEARKGK